MIETVFVVPGQGSYEPGAFAGYHVPELTEVFETVDRVAAEFGRPPISPLLRQPGSPSAGELAKIDSLALQLAIYASSLCWYQLALRSARPDVLVGHSMGEIAALTAAGVFDIVDGARLVCHRALALLETCPDSGGMLALGLNARRAQALVEFVDSAGLTLAVRNAPQQSVVAGDDEGLAALRRAAESVGVTVTALTAPYPFHSPLVALAGPAFKRAATTIGQHPLRARVYSPSARRYLDDRVDAKAMLVEQLTREVDFLAAIRQLHADGARNFIECGKVGLAGLIRRSVPEVNATSAEAPESIHPTAPVNGSHVAGHRGIERPADVAQPGFSQPPFSQPAPGQPASGQPAFGQPALGQPAFGQPAFAQPTYPPPVTMQPADVPTYVQPAAVQPTPVQPTYVQPAPLQPTYVQPAYVQSAPVQPTYVQPTQVQPAAAPAYAQPGSARSAPAPEVLTELLELYASSLGYPLEAMTGDADLEADLGIDSLKRAEMLGKVRAHFGLSDALDDGRFLAQPTLAELAELVAAAR